MYFPNRQPDVYLLIHILIGSKVGGLRQGSLRPTGRNAERAPSHLSICALRLKNSSLGIRMTYMTYRVCVCVCVRVACVRVCACLWTAGMD